MGQIYNRVKRFLKSETITSGIDSGVTSDSGFKPFDVKNANNIVEQYDSDDELKKIIDELKNENKNESQENSANFNNKVMTPEMAFKVLGIKDGVSIEEIKSAYKQRLMEYHPDRVANLGDELKILAERKTKEINFAYGIIRKVRMF
jgi:DnaJ-domain-containing protein 1